MSIRDIKFTEPKLKDFKCFRLPIDNLPKYREVLILGNVYNFFGTYKDDNSFGFTQTPWSGDGAADNFMNFGQFVANGGHATIIASKETCNYYRRLYREFKTGFGITHPKVTLYEIDDIKFLTGKLNVKEGKEEKLVKGEYFWSQNKKGEWVFSYLDLLKTIFKDGEKKEMAVIANPPYGNKGTLAADIIDFCKKQSKWDNVFLTPKTSFRYVEEDTFKESGDFSKFFKGEDYFNNASFTSKLVISHISKSVKNPYPGYETFVSSQCEIYSRYRNFQKTHDIDVKVHKLSFSTWHFTDEQVKDFTKDLPRERIFVATHRNVSDGVHIRESSFDIQYNLKGVDFQKQTDCVAYEFKTKEERDNFTNWYYSTGKSGLSEYLSKLVSYGNIAMRIWFPHIDWSFERTDENIIKELKKEKVFSDKWSFDDFTETINV